MSAQAAMQHEVQSPMTKQITNIAARLSEALQRHGSAVNTTTVLDGLKAVATMQDWCNYAERKGDENMKGVEWWAQIATDAVLGRDAANSELDKWI